MESSEKGEKKNPATERWNKLYWLGILLMGASTAFLPWNFYPVLLEEGRYYLERKDNVEVVTKEEAAKLPVEPGMEANMLEPVDEDFGIVIPKILANTRVIAGVNPNNPAEYQRALANGVAQAKGSADPGEPGNVFIFSHSGIDFYEANRYNAIFYLLNKLEKGDEVYLFYQGKKIRYEVTEKKTVNPEDVQYIASRPGEKIVTLMTCWPAGTAFKRLIVIAQQVDQQ